MLKGTRRYISLLNEEKMWTMSWYWSIYFAIESEHMSIVWISINKRRWNAQRICMSKVVCARRAVPVDWNVCVLEWFDGKMFLFKTSPSLRYFAYLLINTDKKYSDDLLPLLAELDDDVFHGWRYRWCTSRDWQLIARHFHTEICLSISLFMLDEGSDDRGDIEPRSVISFHFIGVNWVSDLVVQVLSFSAW